MCISPVSRLFRSAFSSFGDFQSQVNHLVAFILGTSVISNLSSFQTLKVGNRCYQNTCKPELQKYKDCPHCWDLMNKELKCHSSNYCVVLYEVGDTLYQQSIRSAS